MTPQWLKVRADLLDLTSPSGTPVTIRSVYMRGVERAESPDLVIAALAWAEARGLVDVATEPNSTGRVALTEAGRNWGPLPPAPRALRRSAQAA